VIEAGARASFQQDSIRFELPLAVPAGPGMHATIWILAPDGKRSGATAVDVHEGSARIVAIVPRPTEAAGKPIVKLDWYRIADSVQAPGAAATEGIVAVGAVAPNVMELRLVRPASLTSGQPIEVRVYACNPVTKAPRTMDLTALLKAGSNTLELTSASDAALTSLEASASFYVPWQGNATPERAKTQTGADFGLDFGYSCNAADARVGQPINCTVDVRRFGSGGCGMLLAEVGLPPGADVDRASLGKLLDNWAISRYELQPDRVVFYLWSWKAEGEHFAFSFTPRYPVRAKAAPSMLSDCYNPDFKVVFAPQMFTVSDRLSK
jgi:hypothetical protein